MNNIEAMRLALEALEKSMEAGGQKLRVDKAITALRQALEQPQTPDDLLRQSEREGWRYAKECEAEVKRLRQALEQPEQEPVAWMSDSPTKGNGRQLHWTKAEAWRWSSNITPLYTSPPSKPWVSLTDEEIVKASIGHVEGEHMLPHSFARAIEKLLREKNHD